ncbi:BNR repeat-containing protein [Salegentibacter sp. F188]|uniref:BNR repeat-containing protein n=1 Tax=Autumnicola patrickiae TaxID=3075591 RepID=A0ABU3E3B3_9FLAO|nr:BNR repeat-containing protein [Salegentibacter sp. F188]MDT0690471.1 BNR repeat-containing protein [Salegentibacter sp. F188]
MNKIRPQKNLFRHFRSYFLLVGFLLLFSGCASLKIEETKIGSGWANNSVNTVIFRQNAITSFQDHQFTAYYDENSNLILAKRNPGSDEWLLHKTHYKGNTKDAHNAISIAVDGNGFLHVSWDHHDTPLRYAISKEPLGLELSEEIQMTGIAEEKVSYPQFYNLPDGNLIFLYRSGQSGRGSLIANSYNKDTKSWKQLHDNLIDGENERNAYWQASVDSQGTIHLSWVWRETWDVSTNHDICYARSTDGGFTWEKSSGEKYNLPITAKTAEYAWKVPQGSSLINQTSMTTDASGNPYIASYWNENNSTQFQIVYLKDDNWQKEHTTFRKTLFTLGGGGTKRIPVSRPEILVNSEGNFTTAYLLFRDEERGNKVSLAYKKLNADNWQIKDLTKNAVGEWEPNFDKELYRLKNQLHIFVQKVTQIDGEGIASEPATPVRILEINNLPN